jgi:hypothetical protein
MGRGRVIAVDRERSVFVVCHEAGETHRCAVFCQHDGPELSSGDILEGDILARGTRALVHRNGICRAVGDSGPVPLEKALEIVGHGSRNRGIVAEVGPERKDRREGP